MSLKEDLEKEIIKNTKKLRGRHTSISEIVDKVPKTLKIQDIYKLQGELQDFYLFVSKNYIKIPKIRYFLAISLASQSSDLLVSLAKDFAKRNNLKLIQYSIFPKTLRINLLSLKELNQIEEYSKSIEILQNFKKILQEKIANFGNLIENR